MKTKLLIEQHFHGCFGVDFNHAKVEDVLFIAREILKFGIGGIFPTIVTDSVENTKQAIAVIKEAAKLQTPDMAKILGIHLEGIFINPEKKGIHNPEHFLLPTIENYKLIEDDFIKIVTLAPELDDGLIDYLVQKGVKVQAGHCVGGDLDNCTGVTHLFNAMSGVSHRGESTALSALLNDEIYTEIIADGIHVSDKALELVLRAKPEDKVILISDCLPCTKLIDLSSGINGIAQSMRNDKCFCHHERETSSAISEASSQKQKPVIADEERVPRSQPYEFTFADEKVFYDGIRATSKDGTLAGSTTLLPDIIKRLAQKNLFNPEYINNPYKYHNIDLKGEIVWDEDWNILEVNL